MAELLKIVNNIGKKKLEELIDARYALATPEEENLHRIRNKLIKLGYKVGTNAFLIYDEYKEETAIRIELYKGTEDTLVCGYSYVDYYKSNRRSYEILTMDDIIWRE